ncbi:MAG: hypothetical protein U0Z44_06550 [Kouleothrix sp.]
MLRRLVAFPLLLLLLLSLLLWGAGLIYHITLAQLAFYGCALAGMLLNTHRLGRLKLLTIPFFFCMVNVASMIAAINLIRGAPDRLLGTAAPAPGASADARAGRPAEQHRVGSRPGDLAVVPGAPPHEEVLMFRADNVYQRHLALRHTMLVPIPVCWPE